ncbi:NAD(P)-dependent oxidoreductase [Kaistia dalseonensis]|uniref:Nucleoside-diphosphate-sugar epimerase n=1 Tax=Kaistia dalseonensis TaxID=410840 RepID=A0ABU0H414_9HYPH|nr:NAD(P)-dependent oxidoreductase [Kaistia dalseonensis]MCX5494468.1 NAD(P)-dependent oxidoreductase [Kaistia dalseonensis]MDQ0437047.1 nucleoside-diphosphate-sugar epimerase [Kaistia dalseonensis]
MVKNIVVTGAAGHLGAKLALHLQQEGHRVTGLDRIAASGPVPIHAADLSRADDGWARHLEGQDAIVHLAADRSPDAGWKTAVPHNIDAVLNLFEAARRAGVPRVVFASSNWVLGGYRFRKDRLGADTVPDPVNPYGMSKLAGERIGAHFSAAHGLSVICLRIGWTQWTHGNRPGPHMAMGRWGQQMWLSDRDFLDGTTAAATVAHEGFAIVNLMSDNPGMRWSLDETRAVLGFSPQDGAAAVLPFRVRLTEWGAWVAKVGIPRLTARLTGSDW